MRVISNPVSRRERKHASNLLVASCAVFLVIVFYACSLYLRSDSFHLRAGSENLEASYHVLWTLRAAGLGKRREEAGSSSQ